jgi:hypothetical protein
LHVCPVAEQSLQAFPRLPHVAVLDVMQVPPWQQPLRQVSRLQLPPPPDELPLDDPDELPLDEPDELPLDEPDVAAHAPLWQDWLLAVQSTHDKPCAPHDVSSVPSVQLPFESQQPAQIAAHPPPSSELLASSPVTVASSPELPEPVVSSPLLPPLLLFNPGPLSVGAGAASVRPASWTGFELTGPTESP